jgi:hypothetical protein
MEDDLFFQSARVDMGAVGLGEVLVGALMWNFSVSLYFAQLFG